MKNKFWQTLFCVVTLVLTAVGCKFEGGVFDPNGVLADDFKKSVIVSNPVGIADGATALTIKIRLVNDNSKVVSGVAPSPTVTGGPTLVGPCTASDSQGFSTCSFISSVAGTFTLSYSFSSGWTVSTSITFNPVSSSNTTGLASAAHHEMSNGTWKASGALGSQTSQSVLSNGPWKAQIDVQPSIVSQ